LSSHTSDSDVDEFAGRASWALQRRVEVRDPRSGGCRWRRIPG